MIHIGLGHGIARHQTIHLLLANTGVRQGPARGIDTQLGCAETRHNTHFSISRGDNCHLCAQGIHRLSHWPGVETCNGNPGGNYLVGFIPDGKLQFYFSRLNIEFEHFAA